MKSNKILNEQTISSNNTTLLESKISNEDGSRICYITTSPYECKNRVLNYSEPSRILITDSQDGNTYYLDGDAFSITHNDMIDVANESGYNLKFDEYNKNQICLVCVPHSYLTNTEKNSFYEEYFYDEYVYRYDYDEGFTIFARPHSFKNFELFKLLGHGHGVLFNHQLEEAYDTENIPEFQTCGYIMEDGTYHVLDEYRGEDKELQDLGLPEFSSTHLEEDCCIRIYKKPNNEQIEAIKRVVDNYFNNVGYCKLEIFENNTSIFYKAFCKDETCVDNLNYMDDVVVGPFNSNTIINEINKIYSTNEDIDYRDIYNSKVVSDNPTLGPIFITNDGKFWNVNKNGEHSEIFGDDDYEADDYYILEDNYNLIKANGGNKWEPFPYIDLWKRPNQAQKEAIITWLYFLVANNKKTVHINTSDWDATYDLLKEIPEDVVSDAIRRLGMNETLTEDTKQQLINKSKRGDNYSIHNQDLGRNRYERRVHSKIDNNVKNFNSISMDSLFKRDILTVKMLVHGETDNYNVTMQFRGVIDQIRREVTAKKSESLNFKIVYRALLRAYNNTQVKFDCSCPDFKYRLRYQAFKNGYGTQYEPRPSDITNPNNTKGPACKHIILVMTNLDWVMKIASVINNYIKYCQQNLQQEYAIYIFPKIYGVTYKNAVQMNLFSTGMLPQDQVTIGTVTDLNRGNRDEHGRWVAGNSFRFKKKDNKSNDENNDDLGDRLFKTETDANGKEKLVFRKDNNRDNYGRFLKGNQWRFDKKDLK